MFSLHALPDDFNLNANWDTERMTSTAFPYPYYLTDTAGNYLTDTAGNRLVGYAYANVSPQMLHALPDDFNLNAE